MHVFRKYVYSGIVFLNFTALYFLFVLYMSDSSQKKADIEWIVRSAHVVQFQHAFDPQPESPYLSPLSSSERISLREQLKVNINQATVDELMELPGIGPVLARKIIEKRKELGAFHAFDDLLEVKGIGARKVNRLRDQIVLKRLDRNE